MSDAEKKKAEPCVDCGVQHKGSPVDWPELEFLRHISAMEEARVYPDSTGPLLKREGIMDRVGFAETLSHICTPEGVEILLRYDDDARPYLQIDGPGGRGRKWRMSRYMTPSEVVRTAFAATLAHLEHELRERFTYKSARVFSPHLDVEELRSVGEDRRRGSPGAFDREGPQ